MPQQAKLTAKGCGVHLADEPSDLLCRSARPESGVPRLTPGHQPLRSSTRNCTSLLRGEPTRSSFRCAASLPRVLIRWWTRVPADFSAESSPQEATVCRTVPAHECWSVSRPFLRKPNAEPTYPECAAERSVSRSPRAPSLTRACVSHMASQPTPQAPDVIRPSSHGDSILHSLRLLTRG